MKAVHVITGTGVPLKRSDVDTDQIIPADWLKRVERTGFEKGLFSTWRDDRDFVLNQEQYQGASILVAGPAFGVGSSREHAVWALMDHGFRVVIAPSFADIFFNNCLKNGLLAIVLDEDIIDRLFSEVLENPGYRIRVDLPAQQIILPNQHVISFDIDPFHKDSHIRGLDDIGLTLEHATEIRAFEERRRQAAPWLFDIRD